MICSSLLPCGVHGPSVSAGVGGGTAQDGWARGQGLPVPTQPLCRGPEVAAAAGDSATRAGEGGQP